MKVDHKSGLALALAVAALSGAAKTEWDIKPLKVAISDKTKGPRDKWGRLK